MQWLSHLQWWSKRCTHLLQTEQCFVRGPDVAILHRWQRPPSMTWACLRRSNSGTTSLWRPGTRRADSAGSKSNAVRCAARCSTIKAANTAPKHCCHGGRKAGTSTEYTAATTQTNNVQPSTYKKYNNNKPRGSDVMRDHIMWSSTLTLVTLPVGGGGVAGGRAPCGADERALETPLLGRSSSVPARSASRRPVIAVNRDHPNDTKRSHDRATLLGATPHKPPHQHHNSSTTPTDTYDSKMDGCFLTGNSRAVPSLVGMHWRSKRHYRP